MKRELHNLTGLRGYAALIVVIYHFSLSPLLGHNGNSLIPHGWMAVDVFFVLSGLVLSYAYASDFTSFLSGKRCRIFIWRRIARLFPAYWLILAAYALKMILEGPRGQEFLAAMSIGDYIGNIAMAAGWGIGINTIIGVSWSVSAELVAYLLFPLMAFLAYRSKNSFPIVLGIAGFALVYFTARAGIGINGELDVVRGDTVWPLLRCLGGFSIGVCMYAFAENAALRRVLDGRIAGILIMAGFLAAALVSSSDLFIYIWIPIIILWLYGNSPIAAAAFGNVYAKWLGEISYSLYLLHALIQSPSTKLARLFEPSLGLQFAYIIVSAVLIACALYASHLSYRFIETPGRDILNRLIGHKRQSDLSAKPVSP